jgi:hypothetical protein
MEANDMQRRRMILAVVALLAVGGLALGGCGDDEGGDASGSASGNASDDTQPDDGGDDTAGDGGGALTSEDEEALLAAAINGNPDEAYAQCITDTVIDAVDAGDLTAEEVRAWFGGTGYDGPVQDYISTPDVVIECSGSPTTTA